MQKVFQDIVQKAIEALEEMQEDVDIWDPNDFEDEVREFTRTLGHRCIEAWAKAKSAQAKEQAVRCECGRKRRTHRVMRVWWMTTFGKVETKEAYLVCPGCGKSDRPFKRLTGVKCRSKSRALQRVLTDFGAEKSFGQASLQLFEHYGVNLHRDSVRHVVEQHAQRAQRFLESRHGSAVEHYQSRRGHYSGEEWLVAQSDGSFVRTGKLEPAVGRTPQRGLPKRKRETQWKEVRLSVVEQPGSEKRLYGSVMGPPQQVGEQIFALALLMGWGERTRVHAVSDGAPWIAQVMADVFPRHRFLLDRYHLIEHLYAGASGLAQNAELSASEWVDNQVKLIDRGEVGKVIKQCSSLAGGDPEHPLIEVARYLDNRRDQLDYALAREQGFPIGSGVVEGGHRHVIQARLKLPGAWWNEETVNPMLALRTLRVNGWWNDFWRDANYF
jgi:hypothetical protein